MSSPTFPTHSRQPFTSTLHNDHRSHPTYFNIWIVILTAILFFVVLSWYNFVLATYNYLIGNNPNNLKNFNQLNFRNMIASLVFAIIWTLLSVVIYYILIPAIRTNQNEETESLHPLLRSEVRDIGRSDISSGVLGAV